MSLSTRLRSETKAAHTTAERSGVMRSLLRSTISQRAYVTLLANLALIYDALEEELERNATHPALAGIEWRSLKRLPALHQDIARLSEGLELPEATDATQQYVRRLHDLGAQSPQLLFAHAYLRYLGDLYGGQILQRIVREMFGSSAGTVTAFYEFDAIGDLPAFKNRFREAIDEVPLGDTDADQMVQEAQRGYELHAQLFEEIEPTAAA